MNRVLILYGTTEGHTRAIAHAIAEPMTRAGIDASVVEAGTLEPQPAGYDGVIVAASVHGGRYQGAVEKWVHSHAHDLGDRPTAFVSVCLAVLQQSDQKVQAELAAIIDRFATRTGWRPPIVKQVAGALLYTRYGFFKRWIMRRIVAKAGGDTDISRDYDYTDWAGLRAFGEELSRRLKAAAAA
jgi:menaquinone-dependent protoporphyrinogen oxidase